MGRGDPPDQRVGSSLKRIRAVPPVADIEVAASAIGIAKHRVEDALVVEGDGARITHGLRSLISRDVLGTVGDELPPLTGDETAARAADLGVEAFRDARQRIVRPAARAHDLQRLGRHHDVFAVRRAAQQRVGQRQAAIDADIAAERERLVDRILEFVRIVARQPQDQLEIDQSDAGELRGNRAQPLERAAPLDPVERLLRQRLDADAEWACAQRRRKSR